MESLDDLAAKFFGPAVAPVRVDVGAMSHPGKVRSNNEDHYSVVRRRRSRDVLLTSLPQGFLPASHDDAYVLAVADGVGGAAFGEVASMLALRTGWDLSSNAFKWHFRVTEREAEELAEMIGAYVRLMHRAILERAEARPEFKGMGTTVTGALTVGLDAIIGHVGDSRAYLFHHGALRPLTRDHTVAQQLVDKGVVSSVADVAPSLRNMLVNCVGGPTPDVRVDTLQVQLASGDQLLLCSDGLTDMVEEPAIARTLNLPGTAQAACEALVELALDGGGKDNVTVVLARYQLTQREG